MELERKEKDQQPMIKSIFVQTIYKGKWTLDENTWGAKKLTLSNTHEVINRKTISDIELPFKLNINEKIYLKDIDKIVIITDIIKSSDESRVYEIESKYIDGDKTEEEAMKEFSIKEFNDISEKYEKLQEDYETLKDDFKEKEKQFKLSIIIPKAISIPCLKNASLYTRIFKWEDVVNDIHTYVNNILNIKTN